MHILWKRAREALPWLLVLLITTGARSAEIFLVKPPKGKSRIVFTATRKIPYVIKQEVPGRCTLYLHGVRLRARKIAQIQDPYFRKIVLIPQRGRTVVKIYLVPGYILRPEESYPPFKLVLVPEKVKPQDLIKNMLKKLYREGKCDIFIYNYNRLLTSRLTMKELVDFTKMHLNCSLEEKQWTLALADIELLRKLNISDEEKERLWLKKIELLLKVKNYDEALAEGKLFIGKYSDPLSDLAAAYMSEALLKLDRVDDAILLLKRAIKARPNSPYRYYLYRQLAKAYYRKRNFLGAYLPLKIIYQQARKVLEEDPEALYDYGSSAYRIGNLEEAKKILLRCFNLYPTSEEAAKCLALLGEIYAKKNNWKVALWFYKECTRLFPQTKAAAVSKIKMADYMERIGRYRDALNLFTEAEILYPNMKDIVEYALYKKGLMLLRLGRYEEAIQTFKDFMLKAPRSKYIQQAEKYIEECEFRIAERNFKKKRWEEALKLLAQFAMKYPQNPFTPKAIKLAGEALVNIVEGKYSRNDCFGLLFFWNNYKNFFPRKVKKGMPLYHVALCMVKQNQLPQAVSLMEWIRKNIGPQFPEWMKLLKFLANYYFDTENYKKALPIAMDIIGNSTAEETPVIHFKAMRLFFAQGNYRMMNHLIEKMKRENAPEKFLLMGYLYRVIYFLEQKNTWAAVKYLRLFLKSPLSLSLYPDKYQYAQILLARILLNRGEKDEAYRLYLRYINTFVHGKYLGEALFMAGYLKPNPVGRYFWNRCISEFPKSRWTKEITAIYLVREIKDEVARAVSGNSSAQGSAEALH